MNDNKLLDCPFCGSEVTEKNIRTFDQFDSLVKVECPSCKCSSATTYRDCPEAIKSWNRRVN